MWWETLVVNGLRERQKAFFHHADPKNAAGGLLIPFSGSRQCLETLFTVYILCIKG